MSFDDSSYCVFLFQISHCYTEELESFPQDLKELLNRQYSVMESDLRMVCSSSKSNAGP